MKVTPTQYVNLLNQAVQADENKQPGMRFFLHPEGSTDQTCRGIGFEPPAAFGLAAVIQSKVNRDNQIELA
ncbi:hypothetical protein [Polaromonas sp. JS666]|uniref:hypothetical protein n=1 Tax=Polaromonas sp. (strain JS666 / ATCC BAA-500) TaxID=296591 RepID=UPI0008921A3B|nr:hypothetical protein [Polaromonas sp. JS666]SDN51552.1 hypothetical protein SAMN05720382_105306 [Polaromonas sp. JS666]